MEGQKRGESHVIDPKEHHVSHENGPWPLAFTISLTLQRLLLLLPGLDFGVLCVP